MAERRMFAKSIVLSDAFLDMPATAKCLYFTFGMLADDDGFVGNPKAIMRQIGAREDDFMILAMKRFILKFPSGVIVIKHWKMNNIVRGDRYHSTVYTEEKDTLVLNDNGSYTEKDGETDIRYTDNGETGIRETEERLGKVRIGKDIYQQIADMYNDTCVSFPRLTTLSDSRKKAIKARLNTYTVEDFKKLFEKAESSSFLKGANDRNWSATFDWMIKDANMAKILEGQYDKRKTKESKSGWSNINRESDDYADFIKKIGG